jgi:hypothetical protein
MTDKKPVSLTKAERLHLYAARRFIDGTIQEKLELKIPIEVYFQDPLFAAKYPKMAFDRSLVPWEPGLADGPTSARFAVVDYNADTDTLIEPAKWNSKTDTFVDTQGANFDRDYLEKNKDGLQFHQVHVWAVLQRALDFFESGFGLGRRIPWAFEGNRLIVVPHAGYGANAFYDRQSKSLQFYYFDGVEGRIDTCLSTDIINHEFGHAVLDGIRPYFIEAISPETAAFHEFMGDLTAILIAFRNNEFRKFIGIESGGDLNTENALSGIAEQFGKAVSDRPYLRSARNELTMQKIAGEQRPHRMSEVLTGAMFDIVFRLSRYYIDKRDHTVPEAFWHTIQRMQLMAIQPLDLLPPADVTFRDYALAVLRAEEIANPTDPDDYRSMMLEVFCARGILDDDDRRKLKEPHQVFERLTLDVVHDVDQLAGSRAEAYRFLDDNRDRLLIPANVDLIVADLYATQKLTRQARRLPKQIVVEYIWREDVELKGPEFGRFDGRSTNLLCGGTLALDQNGNVLAWARKPGTQFRGRGQRSDDERAERIEGDRRLQALLNSVKSRVKAGRIGDAPGGERGLLGTRIPPLTSREIDGAVRFELSPHFAIHDDSEDEMGERRWQISS